MIYNTVGEIYEAIAHVRAKLGEVSMSLSEADSQSRENGEGWTIAEIIEHLGIVEGGISKIFERLLIKAEAEGQASDGRFDPPLSIDELIKSAAGRKFEAPAHARPEGIKSVEESLVVLEATREALIGLRSRIETVDLSETVFPHPAFGNLNLYQWLIFLGLHERRHLDQMKRIINDTN